MCVQCKDLIGCSKSGCTQTSTGKASVAELLARTRTADEKAQTALRNQARRETPARTAAAS